MSKYTLYLQILFLLGSPLMIINIIYFALNLFKIYKKEIIYFNMILFSISLSFISIVFIYSLIVMVVIIDPSLFWNTGIQDVVGIIKYGVLIIVCVSFNIICSLYLVFICKYIFILKVKNKEEKIVKKEMKVPWWKFFLKKKLQNNTIEIKINNEYLIFGDKINSLDKVENKKNKKYLLVINKSLTIKNCFKFGDKILEKVK